MFFVPFVVDNRESMSVWPCGVVGGLWTSWCVLVFARPNPATRLFFCLLPSCPSDVSFVSWNSDGIDVGWAEGCHGYGQPLRLDLLIYFWHRIFDLLLSTLLQGTEKHDSPFT